MKRFVLIVEGQADASAAGSLIAKTAATFGKQAFAADPPIRAGCVRRLLRPGEVERLVRLAATRNDVDEILILLDLEDDCPAEMHQALADRTQVISAELGTPVKICFCVREYETWFLHQLPLLRQRTPEYGWDQEIQILNPEGIRGAKEFLKKAAKGKGYRQCRDQAVFTKKLDIQALVLASRSFRKLARIVTNLSYEALVASSEVAETA